LEKIIEMRVNVLRLLGTNWESSLFERVEEVKRSQTVENGSIKMISRKKYNGKIIAGFNLV